ncbi:Putative tartrate transporter [Paraburkholderia domus]|nr:Putative tartrate transporter [Paraburkholderia domus]CAE6796555.1 Putative tartrate transporter [Paraburkholderia domus]CAE6853175.1 Putative tartrate transporter [Paraburkholderia domus]CAE6884461.1 Putative tartrate transporter [Paraburkholderia domus]CAE6927991.1 Putative tartrate transporter [Paraburkholderia domus]
MLLYLTDKPADATWLADDERNWLVARQAQEREHREAVHIFSVKEALFNPRVLAVALIYFGANATNYGLSFFLPQIVKSFGLTNLQTGLVTSLPYIVGVISMIFWGRHSDRKLERKWHVAIALLVAAGGIAAVNSLGNLAGFFGPYAMGWIKDSTGGFGAGLLCLSGAGLVGVAAVLLLHHDTSLEASCSIPDPGAAGRTKVARS